MYAYVLYQKQNTAYLTIVMHKTLQQQKIWKQYFHLQRTTKYSYKTKRTVFIFFCVWLFQG